MWFLFFYSKKKKNLRICIVSCFHVVVLTVKLCIRYRFVCSMYVSIKWTAFMTGTPNRCRVRSYFLRCGVSIIGSSIFCRYRALRAPERSIETDKMPNFASSLFLERNQSQSLLQLRDNDTRKALTMETTLTINIPAPSARARGAGVGGGGGGAEKEEKIVKVCFKLYGFYA